MMRAVPTHPALFRCLSRVFANGSRATRYSLILMFAAFPALSQNAETSPATAAPQWTTPSDLIENRTAPETKAHPAKSRPNEADILSCPFETLRAAYLSLYDDTDALNVAALESEVFKVCIARQKQVKLLLDFEARLRIQLGDLKTAATPVAHPRIPAPATPDAATPPESFRAAKAAALAQPTQAQCSDRYTSGPVFGSATMDGGLHAFVFDATRGTQVTVKSGSTLPGGLTIARISGADGVIVSEQGVERPLAPVQSAPAWDDGGGLLFETTSLTEYYKSASPADTARNTDQDTDLEAIE